MAATVAWLARLWPDNPYQALIDELKAVDTAERIRRITKDRGPEMANAIATNEYIDTIKRLDAKQARLADSLRADPAKRVRYLRRMSRRFGKRQANDHGV